MNSIPNSFLPLALAAAFWHRERAPTAAKGLGALQMKTKRLEFHLEPAGSERRARAVTWCFLTATRDSVSRIPCYLLLPGSFEVQSHKECSVQVES